MSSVQPHTYAVHWGIPTSLLRFVKAVPGFFADLERSLLGVQPKMWRLRQVQHALRSKANVHMSQLCKGEVLTTSPVIAFSVTFK